MTAPKQSEPRQADPYSVLHWVLAGAVGGSFMALVLLIAFWHEPWSSLAQVVAALLAVAGSVTGLAWVREERQNATLPEQWANAGQPAQPAAPAAPAAQQTSQAGQRGDDDADWQVGE